MTVNAVRLNHAVLFVADLERSISFYSQAFGMTVMAREPRANAAFLRLPRSGNHHDLGLFGVGAQPPRPRGALGLYHLAWQVDTIDELEEARLTLADLDAYTGESSHGATKSLYGTGPGRQRVRGDVDAAQAPSGATTRTPRPSSASTSPARYAAGAGSAPPPSSSRCEDACDERGYFRPTGRRDARLHRPDGAAGRAAARPRLRRARDPRPRRAPARPGRRTPRCGRRSPRAAGYAWFANRGIGRPVAESLRSDDGLVPQLARRGRARGTSGAPRRLQRRRRLRRRPRPRRPGPVRRRRDPLRHPPVRRRASRPTPAGWPTCRSSSRRATATTSSRASSSTGPGTTCCPSRARPTVAAPRARRPPAHRRGRPPARRLDRPPPRLLVTDDGATPAGLRSDVRWPTLRRRRAARSGRAPAPR